VKRSHCAFIALILALLATAVAGQQPQKGDPAAPASQADATPSRGVPVRVQLVVARYKGDKKITSLPYTMSAATGQMARLFDDQYARSEGWRDGSDHLRGRSNYGRDSESGCNIDGNEVAER
jgi:hypothetical protein